MHILKGFVTSPSFISNAVDEVSIIGELSKNSMTYSTEVGIYQNEAISDVTLHTFKSTVDNIRSEVPAGYDDLVLRIGEFIYKNTLDQVFLNNSAAIRDVILDEFSINIFELNLGAIVGDDGLWIPEWISFKTTIGSDYIKLWFVDSSFATQYDEYEIKVLSPIPSLDVLFLSKEVVEAQVLANGVVQKLDSLETLTKEHPYTTVKGLEFEWRNVDFPDQRLTLTWLLAVYGNQADNSELLKEAIVKDVLENSSYSSQEWVEVLPDLFQNNEIILTPLWHKYAIPNQTVQSGFNSPFVELGEVEQIIGDICRGSGYSLPGAMSRTVVSTTPIKTMAFLATGNEFNSNQTFLLNEIYPDLINVSSSSLDFSRMQAVTQLFAKSFIDMLVIADTNESDITVPFGFGKTVRDNILYVTKQIGDYNYLVPTRRSVINALGLDSPYYPDPDELDNCDCNGDAILLEDHLNGQLNPHQTDLAKIDLGLLVLPTGSLPTDLSTGLSTAIAAIPSRQ